MRVKMSVLSIAALSLAVGAGTANAQLSNYYVTDGSGGVGTTHGWNGGANFLNYTWANAAEISIYTTGNVIRQATYFSAGTGTEYDMAGTPTGNVYTQGSAGAGNYDAGFDGQNVYQVDYNTGNVARLDMAFQNETILFSTGGAGDSLGITFDGATGHIWTSGFATGIVQEWDLAGNLISTFSIQGGAAALAWDSQDDSLWLYNTSASAHEQYSKSGALLSSYTTGIYVLGGEMAPIPAPASLTLLGLGGLAATRRRRRV